ncbi:hypothetical protein AGMMS50248_07090 [Deltaproteobacteria bacterium]|nr:hypothetical protein AGMMS50248_07090 [Deltaproteobacteria bacterium]
MQILKSKGEPSSKENTNSSNTRTQNNSAKKPKSQYGNKLQTIDDATREMERQRDSIISAYRIC